jgi:hypothetical protein
MRTRKHRNAAAEWLIGFLKQDRSRLWQGIAERRAADIKAAGAEQGYSWRTLNRIKKEHGIKSYPARGGWRKARYWYIAVPIPQRFRRERLFPRTVKIDKPNRSL